MRVPGDGGDAVAFLDPELLEGVRELPGTPAKFLGGQANRMPYNLPPWQPSWIAQNALLKNTALPSKSRWACAIWF